MIYCDTREQKNFHILEYFAQRDIDFEVRKLDTGDYMDSDRMNITIDRKKDLNELAGNLCTRDSSRFWRELRRAKESGIKMIVLCECGGFVKSIEDVKKWKSPYSRISGRMLADKLYRAHISYHVEFLFCDKRSTGRRIVELLNDGQGD